MLSCSFCTVYYSMLTSLCGLCRACSSYMQASTAFLDAPQCNLAAALWSRDLAGEACEFCLLWGPPRSRGLPTHPQLGWGISSVLCLPGTRWSVSHTPVTVSGELVHCFLVPVFVLPLTQVEFSMWTGASMFVQVFIIWGLVYATIYYFLFSLVNDQTNFWIWD